MLQLSDLSDIVDALKKEGLAPMLSPISLSKPVVVGGLAEYNEGKFKIEIKDWTTSLYTLVMAKPSNVRSFVLYPDDLPTPIEISVMYTPSDLKIPELYAALLEVDSKIIHPQEVRSSHWNSKMVYLTEHLSEPVQIIETNYGLQKWNRQHTDCILAIDKDTVDIKFLPYHERQEEHDCIPNKEFPILPFYFGEMENTGIELNIQFNDMGRERMRELLVGLPLPISTSLHFSERGRHNDYFISMSIQPKDRILPFHFTNTHENLEGMLRFIPYFMRFYNAFTK